MKCDKVFLQIILLHYFDFRENEAGAYSIDCFNNDMVIKLFRIQHVKSGVRIFNSGDD